jgi:hypothetical protein
MVSGTTLPSYSCSCVDAVGQPHRPPGRGVPCGQFVGERQNDPEVMRSVAMDLDLGVSSVVMRLGWPCFDLYFLLVRAGRVMGVDPVSLVPGLWTD